MAGKKNHILITPDYNPETNSLRFTTYLLCMYCHHGIPSLHMHIYRWYICHPYILHLLCKLHHTLFLKKKTRKKTKKLNIIQIITKNTIGQIQVTPTETATTMALNYIGNRNRKKAKLKGASVFCCFFLQ